MATIAAGRKLCPEIETCAMCADGMDLSVQSLHRSIDFYALVFGFDVVDVATHGARRRVTLTLADRSRLQLREQTSPVRTRSAERRRMVVDDLEQVREKLWDFGIPVANDPPLHPIHRLFARHHALLVHDPDGHEIEVVQRSSR